MKDFQIYQDKLVVTSSWLYNHIMTRHSYDYYVKVKKFNVLRSGGGPGRPALIDYESMPPAFKDRIYNIVGDPYRLAKSSAFEKLIQPDYQAREYYAKYIQDGVSPARIKTYIANAEVLNACLRMYAQRRTFRRARGGETKNIWESISAEVNMLDKAVYPHSLPKSKDALRKKARAYDRNGYYELVHKNFGNKAAEKRNEKLDYLILSIYTMQNKPYAEVVHGMYEQFLAGNLHVVDKSTGELFDPAEPYYKEISAATVWNIVNEPKYQALITKLRDGDYEYSHKQRPFHHRTHAKFSLSKISLDDRDIMHTKTRDGQSVKAYYIYDTLSQAIIGRAYNRKKNADLFIDSIKDMFRFLKFHKLGMPLQAEVEHHLVSDFKDSLMRIFPFVRWCNPTNSQEKWAETGIRLKKLGIEKQENIGVGRFYSRLPVNRVTQQKIFDEDNNNYKERKGSFKEIVANDKSEIDKHNNALHPNQDKFPGKTRLQVLMEYANPNLPELDEALLAYYVGERVVTSIRRNHFVKAINSEFALSTFDILNRLQPGNLNVTAFYIPDEHGEVDKLYLYQNDKYIGGALPINTYNTANAEWTDKDIENYQKQAAYVAQFDKMIKDKKAKTSRVAIIPNDADFVEQEPEIIPSLPDTENIDDDFSYDYENITNKAYNDL